MTELHIGVTGPPHRDHGKTGRTTVNVLSKRPLTQNELRDLIEQHAIESLSKLYEYPITTDDLTYKLPNREARRTR